MKEQSRANKEVYLAPLAGVTDVSFRIICEKYGADKTFTEMVSTNSLYYNNKKTEELMFISDLEKNCNIQLFGSDPDIIYKVIKEKINPLDHVKEISFNMGCPAPKITKNGQGSALMANPALVRDICDAMFSATDKKTNIKFRLGLDFDHQNYLQIGKIAQDCGIDYVILHARTKDQMYSGKANREDIRKLKEALTIPVIANGDVFSVEDYIKVMDLTGADGVMLARGVMGNPFLFKQIKDYQKFGHYQKPTSDQIIDQIIEQYELSLKYKSEKLVVTQMRKHIGRYIKGLKDSAKIRQEVNQLKTTDEILNLLGEYKDSLKG